MATQQTKSKKSESQFARTRANKIRKLTRELQRNPNNPTVRASLEFWQTHDRKIKRHGKH